MKRFQHRENGRIVKLLEVFEKSGTMLVQFEDDGTTKNYSPVTIRRWWKELPEEEEVVEEEELAGDSTSYKQVMNEILADEKLAVKKKAKKEKTTTNKGNRKEELPIVQEIIDFIDKVCNKKGIYNYMRAKQPDLYLYKRQEEGSKVLFRVRKTKTKVYFMIKSTILLEEYMSLFDEINELQNKRYTFTELNKDNKQMLMNIINSL